MKISNEELNSILKKLTEHIYEEYEDYMEFDNLFINNVKEFSSNFCFDLEDHYKGFCEDQVEMIDDWIYEYYEGEENDQILDFLYENDRLYKETIKNYSAINEAIYYTIRFIERKKKLLDFGFNNDIVFWVGIKDFFDKTHTEAYQLEIQKLEENISRLKAGKKPINYKGKVLVEKGK